MFFDNRYSDIFIVCCSGYGGGLLHGRFFKYSIVNQEYISIHSYYADSLEDKNPEPDPEDKELEQSLEDKSPENSTEENKNDNVENNTPENKTETDR